MENESSHSAADNVNRALDLSEALLMDRLLDILDTLHYYRIDVAATATHLGIPPAQIAAAHEYDLHHGLEIYRARADRHRRGGKRVLPSLKDVYADRT